MRQEGNTERMPDEPSPICGSYYEELPDHTKRKQLDDKKVLDAYHSGNKTAEEIIEFILSDGQKQE